MKRSTGEHIGTNHRGSGREDAGGNLRQAEGINSGADRENHSDKADKLRKGGSMSQNLTLRGEVGTMVE